MCKTSPQMLLVNLKDDPLNNRIVNNLIMQLNHSLIIANPIIKIFLESNPLKPYLTRLKKRYA